MYVNAKAELVTLALGLRPEPEQRFAPLARGKFETYSLTDIKLAKMQVFTSTINSIYIKVKFSRQTQGNLDTSKVYCFSFIYVPKAASLYSVFFVQHAVNSL